MSRVARQEPADSLDLFDLLPAPPPPVSDDERLEQLLAELPVTTPRRCGCERPLLLEHEACLLCGRAPRGSP